MLTPCNRSESDLYYTYVRLSVWFGYNWEAHRTPVTSFSAQNATSCCWSLSFFLQASSAVSSNARFFSAVAHTIPRPPRPAPPASTTEYQQPMSTPWQLQSLQALNVPNATCPPPLLPRSDTRGAVTCPPTMKPQAIGSDTECWCPPAAAAWTTAANIVG
jgi:hypothetical protein